MKEENHMKNHLDDIPPKSNAKNNIWQSNTHKNHKMWQIYTKIGKEKDYNKKKEENLRSGNELTH